jgi:hypothetical protein
MNYLAHGLECLDDPYVLAGTAVPDWLNVADRAVRVRSKHAAPFVADADLRHAAVARGIVQHHRDDAWFHDTAAFHELSWRLTALARDALRGDEGFRPSFLGHILVEILLDAALIKESPERLEAYYRALGSLDGEVVQAAVNRMAPRSTERLAAIVPRFCQERFLWDYREDGRLFVRLNQVMRRVKLPELPEGFSEMLAVARPCVAARQRELLTPPPRRGDSRQTAVIED